MSFFTIGRGTSRYGAIIDIGSGSVLTAIVHSDTNQEHPQIVWSYREHAPLRDIESIEQSAKAVMTALINASMKLDSEGRRALREYDNKAKLTKLQCGISAPWSYTVTKTINYSQETLFLVTKELIDELLTSIKNDVGKDLAENEALHEFGLEIIAESDINILSNGYRVKHPEGGKASTLAISHTSVVAQQYLIAAIDEMRDKLFAETEAAKLSFILMLYTVSKELLPGIYDICLVDITYEATEIGIVRDGSLKYCTHTPFGSFSLAREISAVTKVPLTESFGYLHTETPYEFTKFLSTSQGKEVEAIFESYIKQVSALFHETGDTLSIPKRIALHADLKSETLFLDLIEKAAKRATKASINITPVSKEIIRQTYDQSTKEASGKIPNDTALLVSAQFFHKRSEQQSFTYF